MGNMLSISASSFDQPAPASSSGEHTSASSTPSPDDTEPEATSTSADDGTEDEDCLICGDVMKDEDAIEACTNSDNHKYHKECLTKYEI